MGHFHVFTENSSFWVRLGAPDYCDLICAWVSSESASSLVPQALTFIIFICFTASVSAYMAAALLEFFITLAFLFLYATQYYQRFDRLNWPCLVRNPASPTPSWALLSDCPIFLLSHSPPSFPQPSCGLTHVVS